MGGFLSAKVWAGIGGVVVITLLCVFAYRTVYDSGVDACEGRHAIALVEHIERAQTQAREIALQDAEFSEAYEKFRTRYITKVEEVTREIPADCASCRISPNGLSLINAARAGGLPMASDTSKPNATMPPITPAPNGDVPGVRWRKFDGHTSVQRLRGDALVTDPSSEGTGI